MKKTETDRENKIEEIKTLQSQLIANDYFADGAEKIHRGPEF